MRKEKEMRGTRGELKKRKTVVALIKVSVSPLRVIILDEIIHPSELPASFDVVPRNVTFVERYGSKGKLDA